MGHTAVTLHPDRRVLEPGPALEVANDIDPLRRRAGDLPFLDGRHHTDRRGPGPLAAPGDGGPVPRGYLRRNRLAGKGIPIPRPGLPDTLALHGRLVRRGRPPADLALGGLRYHRGHLDPLRVRALREEATGCSPDGRAVQGLVSLRIATVVKNCGTDR